MIDEPLSYDGEEWKPVLDERFGEPLEASSYGRVRRMGHRYLRGGRPGVAPFWSTKRLRIAHVYFQQGYPYVNAMIDGRWRGVGMHILVCIAWHGPRPSERHEAAHCDGNSMNDTPGNLRWATFEENNADKHRHDRMYQGEDHHLAELTEAKVREIRALYDANPVRGALTNIAGRYGVTRTAISSVVKRRTWKHVT